METYSLMQDGVSDLLQNHLLELENYFYKDHIISQFLFCTLYLLRVQGILYSYFPCTHRIFFFIWIQKPPQISSASIQ